ANRRYASSRRRFRRRKGCRRPSPRLPRPTARRGASSNSGARAGSVPLPRERDRCERSRPLVAVSKRVVANQAMKEGGSSEERVLIEGLPFKGMKGSCAGGNQRGGALTMGTASHFQHLFVDLPNKLHELVQPLYFFAISLIHSLFSLISRWTTFLALLTSSSLGF